MKDLQTASRPVSGALFVPACIYAGVLRRGDICTRTQALDEYSHCFLWQGSTLTPTIRLPATINRHVAHAHKRTQLCVMPWLCTEL